MKKLTALLLAVAFCGVFVFPPQPVVSQSQEQTNNNIGPRHGPKGKIINSYRMGQGARPAWVGSALTRSLAHLKQEGNAPGLADAEAELTLLGADQDDLGMTHVRLAQTYRGVPVFGGQLIQHLDATDASSINRKKFDFANGRVFPDARKVSTAPAINAAKAIALAIAELGYKGVFAREPEAELVVLPEGVKKSNDAPGATLTYKVELFVNDGKEAARHFYFVNAHNGTIEWHYDNLQRGTGNSLYSGVRNIGTTFTGSIFEMRDPSRTDARKCPTKPGIITSDFVASGGNRCIPFTDFDDIWGDGTNSNRQTTGVDAHFGATLTYDYFQNQHGRLSLDGANIQMCNQTHSNGNGVDNAFWDGQCTNYGDGSINHWASIDVVGHEFTHAVTEFTAGLIYDNQSGGANESFSDIFGTMVEFASGISPDYLIAEDVNGGIRSMSNPRSFPNLIDHFSQYNDSLDVHYSSGLQNIAFYLLAESGVHPTSGISVKRILRENAADVYYRALTVYLGPSAHFSDVRQACEFAARDFYSSGNPMYQATQRSWYSVGVGGDVPFNPIDNAGGFVAQLYRDFLLREPDQSGLAYWTGQITQCGNDAECEDRKRVDVARAFWYAPEFQQQARAANLLNPSPPPDFDSREFVRLCYVIYLQREPDQAGWDFWTNELNNDIGNGVGYNHLIKAFIACADYRQRFGPA